MIRDSVFYKIISAVHIVLFTSMLCFGIIYLSVGLFMMPALGATFKIGKDYLCKKLDITDSIVRTYLKYFKTSLHLMKLLPINLILIANIIGMLVTAKSANVMYSIICLSITSSLLVFMLYIAGYDTFIEGRFNCTNVLISMFVKPFFVLPIFMIMVLCVFFFSSTLMIILLLTGTFFLFALEVVVLISMLFYKKVIGTLAGDEFEYLLHQRG